MNLIMITGNIATDIDAHTTQSGISRASFKVAVQRRFRNANGEREADFLPVVAWRQTADYCTKYLKKGNKVAVQGSVQTRSYDAQDGSKRYVTEIIAENIEGLSKPENGAQGGTQKPASKPANDGFVEVDDDGDLPFD